MQTTPYPQCIRSTVNIDFAKARILPQKSFLNIPLFGVYLKNLTNFGFHK